MGRVDAVHGSSVNKVQTHISVRYGMPWRGFQLSGARFGGVGNPYQCKGNVIKGPVIFLSTSVSIISADGNARHPLQQHMPAQPHDTTICSTERDAGFSINPVNRVLKQRYHLKKQAAGIHNDLLGIRHGILRRPLIGQLIGLQGVTARISRPREESPLHQRGQRRY